MSFPEQTPKRIAVVRVSGKDKNLWQATADRFREVIRQMLDLQVNQETGSTVRDELQEFVRYGSEWVKETLKRPGVENLLKLQEASKVAAERIKTLAEAESVILNNRAQKFRDSLTEMKFYLLVAKAGGFDNETDADILMFAKTADAWLFAIAEMEKAPPK